MEILACLIVVQMMVMSYLINFFNLTQCLLVGVSGVILILYKKNAYTSIVWAMAYIAAVVYQQFQYLQAVSKGIQVAPVAVAIAGNLAFVTILTFGLIVHHAVSTSLVMNVIEGPDISSVMKVKQDNISRLLYTVAITGLVNIAVTIYYSVKLAEPLWQYGIYSTIVNIILAIAVDVLVSRVINGEAKSRKDKVDTGKPTQQEDDTKKDSEVEDAE